MAKQDDKNQNNQDSSAEDSGTQQQPAPTILSWSIRGLSLLLIIALLGYFVWAAFQPEVKPDITFEVQTEKIEQRGREWAVPVKITNSGGMSVHNLSVQAALPDDEKADARLAEIMMMGPGEEISTTFWFNEDPREKTIECTVNSYLLP